MYLIQTVINWMTVLYTALPVVGMLAGIWLKGFVSKKESTAEIAKKKAEETLILEQAKEVAEKRTKVLIDEYKDLVQTLVTKMQQSNVDKEEFRRQTREEIKALQEENREQKNENIECELRADAAELEMMLIRKELNMTAWIKETVFVLDDNKIVLLDFAQRFKRITALDYKGYTDYELFIHDANIEQPGIVVLDWHVAPNVTAENVKARLGYTPEIFIMSHDKAIQTILSEKRMKFFYKGALYVQQIVKAIFEYLKDKN